MRRPDNYRLQERVNGPTISLKGLSMKERLQNESDFKALLLNFLTTTRSFPPLIVTRLTKY